MQRPQLALPFPGELIIDNFAGGGGTSTGLEAAFGRPVDIAINHDPEALAMHALNHPYTKHLCESVWDIDPIEVTGNRPVGLVWLSPDCKHFSKAKGGTPVSKHIRGLAWVGMRWVALTKPRVLMLENVEEFQTWGPVIVGADGNLYPDPAKNGKTFESFVRQLRQHGYKVDWRALRACDNGAPTIRKRLFLVARRDGLPIIWPEATHGEPTSREVLAGMLAPHRTAAECIDFGLPATSIFDRPKPLAANTRRRVAKGLWRHVLSSARPFIVTANKHALVAAHLAHLTHHGDRAGTTPAEPLPTVTGANRGEQALVVANLIDMGHGESCSTGAKRWSSGVRSLETPLNSVTAYLVQYYSEGGQDSGCAKPMPTVTTKARMGLVQSVQVPAEALSPEHREKARACAALLHEHLPDLFPEAAELVLMSYGGICWVLVDITLRMLKARELYRAQSFPDDYIIHEIPDPKLLFKDGVQVPGDPRLIPRIPLSITAQVRMCGNSVSPAQAEALVRANFRHEEAFMERRA